MTPDYDDLDPDVFCLTHGKPLATKCASYCEDCEPPEREWEPATPLYDRDEQARILRELK